MFLVGFTVGRQTQSARSVGTNVQPNWRRSDTASHDINIVVHFISIQFVVVFIIINQLHIDDISEQFESD